MADHYSELIAPTPNAPRAAGRICARCGEPIAYKAPAVNGLHVPDCYRADRDERLAAN